MVVANLVGVWHTGLDGISVIKKDERITCECGGAQSDAT